MLTMSAIGGLLGSLAAPSFQKHLSPFTVVTTATVIWTLLIALFPIDLNPYVVSALLSTITFGGPTLNAILVGRQIAIVPDQLQARVEGAASVLGTGAVSLGVLAAGFMLDRLGSTLTIEAFAALMALLALTLIGSTAVKSGLAATAPAHA
jgi:predicted MFS family arabinose efflux permease